MSVGGPPDRAAAEAPRRARQDQQRRDLRAITRDGVAFSIMVGLGETYVPAFALAAGLGTRTAMLVATLPILAGALLQLVTPAAVQRLGSYRRWVVICAALQAACFLPLASGALAGRISALWLFAVVSAYWGFGMATGPPWNAWVGTLVPRGLRARFFARRTRWAQLALFLAILAGGAVLDLGARAGRPLLGFASLFALAACARGVSSRMLASQSETPGLAAGHDALGPLSSLARLRGSRAAPLLGYLLAMQSAVNLASPLFTPYMLGPLELSYGRYMALTAAAFLSRVALMPVFGRWAVRRGPVTLLWWGALAIVPLPALWMVSDSFAYLLGLQLLAGAAWGAMELATLLCFFESLPVEDRSSVLTVYNAANAAAVAGGALLGAAVFSQLGGGVPAYAALFALSSAGRLLALPLLRRAPRPEHVHGTLGLRTLAVRPSAGAQQSPILPTLDDEQSPAR